MGIILNNKGDFKDAVPPLQKATTMAPKDVQAWFLLGSAYTGMITPNQQGDKMTYDIPAGTTDAYQKVIDLDPNGPYAAQAKQNLDALAAMAGGDATAVGVRPKKKKSMGMTKFRICSYLPVNAIMTVHTLCIRMATTGTRVFSVT